MIYKRFGSWWGLLSLFDLLLINFLTLVTRFAAIALALKKLGVHPRMGVPLSAIALMFLVGTGSYRRWERTLVALCLLDIGWIAIAFFLRPPGVEIIRNSLVPSVPESGITASFVFLVIAIAGTTIAPWQLFFQQSCVVDKRLRFSDLKWARLDTLVGAVFTIVVAGCMVIVGNASKVHGIPFADPAQMAVALRSFISGGVRTPILL